MDASPRHDTEGSRWLDRITNIEVLNRAKSCSIGEKLIKALLRWVGNTIRMTTIGCRANLCMANWCQIEETRGVHVYGTQTLQKQNTWIGGTFSKNELETVTNSLLHVSGVIEQQPRPLQQQTSSAPTAIDSAHPNGGCIAIFVFIIIDESHTPAVIFGPEGQPRSSAMLKMKMAVTGHAISIA